MTGEATEFKWGVPLSQVETIKERLIEAGATVNPQTESFEPPPDEAIDYARASFEPILLITGSMGLGYLIKKISDAVLDARHGGAIVDARAETLEVRSNPSVPRGTIVVIRKQKVETLRDSAPDKLEKLLKSTLTGR